MFSSIIPLFVLLLQLYCFPPGVSSLENVMEQQNPEVESKWEMEGSIGQLVEGVDSGNGVNFYGDTILTSPKVSELVITCSAHYPIQWIYKLTAADFTTIDYSPISLTSLRTSEDFHDPKSYKFYAYLRLRRSSNKITGWYNCSNTANETLSVSRYIYWKGIESKGLLLGELPPPRLYYGWRYESPPTHVTVMADKENKTIVIPCVASYPSATMSLYWKKNDDFHEINWRNEAGVSFDPKIGFTLQLQEYSSLPYGIYKCKKEKEADVLIVKVVEFQQPETTPNVTFNNTLILPAKFSYDGKTQTIVCCSSGARAYSSPCRSDDSSSPQNCENIKIKLKDFMLFNRGAVEHMNCRKFTITDSEGMFRCFGPGIDIIRRYFIPPTNSTLIYFDDEIPRIPKEDLIQVSPHGNIYSGYSNINLTLECHPAASMFSYGVRWSILWKNGTVELFPDVPTYNNHELTRTLQIASDTNMVTAICHAPLLKSLGWIDKKISLNITELVAPVISGPPFQEYLAASMPFSFTCNVERGNPSPVIKWLAQNYYNVPQERFKEGIVHTNGNNNATITIIADKYYLFGNYTCNASNIAGSSKKTFRITKSAVTTTTTTTTSTTPLPESTSTEFSVKLVNTKVNTRHPERSWTTLEIILTVLVCVLVLAGIGGGALVLVKRRQRKSGEQKSLSYKDLGRSESTPLDVIDERVN